MTTSHVALNSPNTYAASNRKPIKCNQRDARIYVATHTPFEASALTGEFIRGTGFREGRLNLDEREQFVRDAVQARAIDAPMFVVFSYATPIAWAWTDAAGVKHTHRVAQKFSVTTSKHQGIAGGI